MNEAQKAKLLERFPNAEHLLTPAEVAEIFKVDPKTVIRWVKRGKLRAIKTPLGHHRIRVSAVQQVLDDGEVQVDGF